MMEAYSLSRFIEISEEAMSAAPKSKWALPVSSRFAYVKQIAGYASALVAVPEVIVRIAPEILDPISASETLTDALNEAVRFVNKFDDVSIAHVELADSEITLWLRTTRTGEDRTEFHLKLLRAWRSEAPWARSAVSLVLW